MVPDSPWTRILELLFLFKARAYDCSQPDLILELLLIELADKGIESKAPRRKHSEQPFSEGRDSGGGIGEQTDGTEQSSSWHSSTNCIGVQRVELLLQPITRSLNFHGGSFQRRVVGQRLERDLERG